MRIRWSSGFAILRIDRNWICVEDRYHENEPLAFTLIKNELFLSNSVEVGN